MSAGQRLHAVSHIRLKICELSPTTIDSLLKTDSGFFADAVPVRYRTAPASAILGLATDNPRLELYTSSIRTVTLDVSPYTINWLIHISETATSTVRELRLTVNDPFDIADADKVIYVSFEDLAQATRKRFPSAKKLVLDGRHFTAHSTTGYRRRFTHIAIDLGDRGSSEIEEPVIDSQYEIKAIRNDGFDDWGEALIAPTGWTYNKKGVVVFGYAWGDIVEQLLHYNVDSTWFKRGKHVTGCRIVDSTETRRLRAGMASFNDADLEHFLKLMYNAQPNIPLQTLDLGDNHPPLERFDLRTIIASIPLLHLRELTFHRSATIRLPWIDLLELIVLLPHLEVLRAADIEAPSHECIDSPEVGYTPSIRHLHLHFDFLRELRPDSKQVSAIDMAYSISRYLVEDATINFTWKNPSDPKRTARPEQYGPCIARLKRYILFLVALW